MKNFWLDNAQDVEVLGTFENESGVLRVSDPCYDKDVWCASTMNALNGTWKSKIVYQDGQVAAILCHHESLDDIEPDSHLWKFESTAGVDSGQCGVFDDKYFRCDSQVYGLTREHDKIICDDEPFYSFCCDRTLGEKQAGVLPYGAVSSSGYGDGSYKVVSVTNEDELVTAVLIDYLGVNSPCREEYDDEEWDDEE